MSPFHIHFSWIIWKVMIWKPIWNGHVNPILMITRVWDGAHSKAVIIVSSIRIPELPMFSVNAEIPFASNVDKKATSLVTVSRLSSGMRRVPTKVRTSPGSLQTRSSALNASNPLKRTKVATIWLVRCAILNFAGFVLGTGKNMDKTQEDITSAISMRISRRKGMKMILSSKRKREMMQQMS